MTDYVDMDINHSDNLDYLANNKNNRNEGFDRNGEQV